jgi:hypothetical protein
LMNGCIAKEPHVEQWTTHEISLFSVEEYANPYTDVDVWAVFKNTKGDSLVRPAFWDGGKTWKIRFSPPDSNTSWQWTSISSNTADKGLHDKRGSFLSVPYSGDNELMANGLLEMSPGKRNVVHKNGKPFLVVGDTPWALPYRAIAEQVNHYAQYRQTQGYNVALMMVVQPDMRAEGPYARNTPLGFARAFFDLPKGTTNELNPEYFHTLDILVSILLDHGIVPVYQPVFHGFGWKGLDVLGNIVDSDEYVRFCKYLLARYGSGPAMWLLGADNDGNDPGVAESGEMMELWDCYNQPTGLHYNPCGDYIATWSVNNPLKRCMHFDKSHQDADWLDFQWTQTGHNGEHNTSKVWRMYDNFPVKAVANGEPTYEGMGGGKNGLGWWQGHEAWMQLMSGGTMGVVYGAASLWQWKITADEEGWTAWSSQPKNWEEAMKMEGARYVGFVGKAFEGIDFTDMERRWDLNEEQLPMLAKQGLFYACYLPEGGTVTINELALNMNYRWFDPKKGEFDVSKQTNGEKSFTAPDDNPWVLILSKDPAKTFAL